MGITEDPKGAALLAAEEVSLVASSEDIDGSDLN